MLLLASVPGVATATTLLNKLTIFVVANHPLLQQIWPTTRINPSPASIMSYSSDEFDNELPDLKKLLERYSVPVEAQKGNTTPPDLFDPVTPPKASRARAPKATVGATAEKAAIGIVGSLDEGQTSVKTPVTAVRKPRVVSKILSEKPGGVKEKPGPAVNRRFKGALAERTNATGRPVEPTKTESLASSFHERSTIAAVLDSSGMCDCFKSVRRSGGANT